MLTKSLVEQILALGGEGKLKTLSLNLIVSLIDEDEESQKYIAVQINKMLSANSSKIEGLELLNNCLPQISPHFISEHAPIWIRCCLNHHEQGQNKEVYLNTLANIIKYSQNHQEFSRKFVTDFLTPTLDISLKMNANLNVQEASLNSLLSCLRYYASSCNFYKKKIEDYVLSYLSTSSERLVSLSGLLFFYCQQIGNAGSDGNNHINNITLNVRKLCVTCHKLFDSIFENQVEFERFQSNNLQCFDFFSPPIHYNTQMKLQYKVQILKNCFNWIMILLRKRIMKVIYPQELLGVIRRAISLHVCMEQTDLSVESTIFALHLIKIQVEVLKMLDIFIRQLGTLLAPFYYTITKIILDIITRSQSCSCYHKDNLLREYMYNVLSIWLKMGRNGFDHSMQDKLVSCIIKDSTSITNAVTLKMDSKLIGKSSKMKRKAQQNKVLARKVSADLSSFYGRELKLNICYNALNTLNILLNHSYLYLSEPVLHKLNCFLTKTLLSIQNKQAIFPFDDQKCQLILYKTVCSLFEQDSIKILPPIQIILNILCNGSQHEDQNISLVCSQGLNNLEKICQPVCSSLYTLDNMRVRDGEKCYETTEADDNVTENTKYSSDLILERETVIPLKKSSEVTVLYNNVITPALPVISNYENVITEIDDDQSENEELKQDGIITVADDHEQNCNSTTNEGDAEVEFVENTLVSKKIYMNNFGLPNYKNEDVDNEPVPKRKKVEDDYELEMLDSLVDEVNDDYE